MDFNVIAGILRAVLPAGIAYAVGKGVLPAGDYSDIVAAIVTLGSAIWSVKTNVAPKA